MASADDRADITSISSFGKVATKRSFDGRPCSIKREAVDQTSQDDAMDLNTTPRPKEGVSFESCEDKSDLETNTSDSMPMSVEQLGHLFLSRLTFPVKLWDLVKEGKSIAKFVKWSDCGMCILLDTRLVEDKIQEYFPGEFGDNKLRNFCRQLRVYDFNEVNGKDPNWGRFSDMISMAPYVRVFYHHFFRKSHPEDVGKIVRVRDVIPRGRSKPKNPKPREVLPGPSGSYHLGFPPSSMIDRARQEAKTINDQPRPTTNSAFSSALEQIGQQTVLSTAGAFKIKTSPLKCNTKENFCQSLLLKPIQKECKLEKAFSEDISEDISNVDTEDLPQESSVPSGSSLNKDKPVTISQPSTRLEHANRPEKTSTPTKPDYRTHHRLSKDERKSVSIISNTFCYFYSYHILEMALTFHIAIFHIN